MKPIMRIGSYLLPLTAMLIVGVGWTASRADSMRAPEAVAARRGPVREKSEGPSPLRHAVRFFRTTISPVDGNRCPMYPTCSQYGEEAVGRHGPVVGLMLIIDRLFHEWSETTTAPQVWTHGALRYWDPLQGNDFWISRDRLPENKLEMGRP